MITDIVNILLYFLLLLWVVVIPSLQYFLFNKENGSYIEYITDVKEYGFLTRLIYILFYSPTLLFIFIYWIVGSILIFIGSIINAIINKVKEYSFLEFVVVIISFTVFSVIVLSILIEEKHADFKNEELSHNIIKNNIDKLENIGYIDTHNLILFDDIEDSEGNEKIYGNVLVLPNKKEHILGRLKKCKILLKIDTREALFREDDINKLGTDGVYEAANVCIDEVVDMLKKDNLIKGIR